MDTLPTARPSANRGSPARFGDRSECSSALPRRGQAEPICDEPRAKSALPLFPESNEGNNVAIRRDSDPENGVRFPQERNDHHLRTVLLSDEFKSHRVRSKQQSHRLVVKEEHYEQYNIQIGAEWTDGYWNPEVLEIMKDLEQEMAINRVKGEISQILPTLGKHRIEELRRVIDRHYVKRFRGKRHTPKYGNLNKGFTDNQLEAFFRAIHNDK